MTDLSNYTDDQLLGMLQEQPNAAQDGSDVAGNTQMDGALRLPAMAGSNLLGGLGKISGTPGDVATLYNQYVGAPGARVFSGQPPQYGVGDPGLQSVIDKYIPPSDKQTESLQEHGLINRPDLQPQNSFEKYLSKGAEGLGSVLPYMAIPADGIVPALKMAAQGVGSGVGDAVSDQFMPGSVGAKLAGSLIGGGVANVASNTTERAANAVQGINSPILQAYKEAGVTPRMVGDVTQNPTMMRLQSFGGNSKAAQQTLDEFGRSVNNMADSMGSSHTLQEAGQAVQESGKSWLKNWKDAQDTAWKATDNLVGPTTTIPSAGLKQAINDVTSSAQGNQALGDTLKSPVLKQTINILQEAPNGILTWGQARALRTHLGQTLENPMLVSGPEQAQAKMLYGGLTNDMKNGVFLTGNPQAMSSFQSANSITSGGHNFIENVLGDVMKKSPEAAASTLLTSGTKGGTTLQALRKNLPDAADELASVSLRRAMAGQSEGSSGNAVSPSRWLSNNDPTRRLSPEAYDALYPEPQVQSKMAALDTVAHNMRNTEKLANHSNTASHSAIYAAPFSAYEGAMRGHDIAGMPGAVAGGIMGGAAPFALSPLAGSLTNNQAVARFLSSPTTRQPLGMIPSLSPMLGTQPIPFSLSGG